MEAQADDYAALKRRLLARIVFAVVVLAGLLASLAVFDRMNAPEPAPEKRGTTPVEQRSSLPAPASSPKDAAAPSDTIKSELTRPDMPGGGVAQTEAPAVPEGSTTPQATLPAVAAGEKPLTRPASGRHALMRSPEAPAPTAIRPDSAHQPGPARVPSSTAASRGTDPAPVSRPLAQAAEKPFALQLGVFSDVANAEELRAKLEKAGIRASIEARVHVGPFATRAEADAARVKLRELGISEAVLFSMKGRKAP